MSSQSVGTTILAGGAGQAIGSLVGPAANAGTGIYKSLKRKYDYIKNLGTYFENLEKEAEFLSSREKDVKDKIARDQIMMEATHECSTWLDEVTKKTKYLKDLKMRYQKVINGSCEPCQFYTRLQLSREIAKATKDVVDLKDRMHLDYILQSERPPERVQKKFPKKIDVPTLSEYVETLLEHLKDDKIRSIGIWGIPGVGKTTILESLNDEVEKLPIFDFVIWVTVSKEENLRQVQEDILKRLAIKGEGIDPATLISKSLAEKKCLLLIDEVFSEINLRDIGIHKSHMLGKVVVATREKFICNLMDFDEEIQVERLSRDDAQKLFRDTVGEVVEHPAIKPIAEKVLKQCGELPQLIRAVGIHLKESSNEDLWRDTLSKLQSPSKYPVQHMEEVFKAFQVIYSKLDDSPKKCLLYGASFPEDYEINQDYLIECWKSELGIKQTLRKAREEGHADLVKLIDQCLFDQCKSIGYVKMPVMFRNAALRVANHDFEILSRDSEELENYPSVEKWENAKVVAFMNSDLTELPEKPKCPKVLTLFLQKNENLLTIPASFFESMSTLKILDFYKTGIKYLPSSISMLTDLRGLYLNDCHQLLHLPEEIGKLQNLEVFDIRSTGIHGIPVVIKELTCLRCLRVSFTSNSCNQNHVKCNGVDEPPSDIFKLFHKLEELTVDANPEDPKWNKIAPEIVVQLTPLSRLSALSFYFPTTESLETFIRTSMSWRKNETSQAGSSFRSFNIYVGPRESNTQIDVSKCSGRRYLQYSNGKDTPNVVKEVLKITCAFKLIGHQNITKFSDFGIDKMEGLEICEVKECNEMTTLVGGNMAETRAFPWLRELKLLRLQKLQHIAQDPISSNSFARLKMLTVYDCPTLSKVVSWEMAKELTELQHLRVERCSQVAEVFELDTQSNLSGTLPKLKILELVSLEELVNIHTSDSFEWHALRQVELIDCDKLGDLCFNKRNSTKLRCIKCNQVWWEALVLSDEIRAHFQAFCCFI